MTFQEFLKYLKQDLIGFLLFLLVVSIAATQFVAWRFHYHPALGTPWFDHYYAPWSWLVWRNTFAEQGKLTFALLNCLLFVAVIVAGWSYVTMLGLRSRKPKQYSDLHGTAHWASEEEVMQTGLLPISEEDQAGVYVGSWADEQGQVHFLRHDGPEHVAAIAPTRSGKGVGLVVPTLLTWEHSVVIHDMKGELWNLTAGQRQAELDNIVLRFDPASADRSCGFNPLEEIRMGKIYEVGDTQNLVSIIVDPDGHGLVDHWARTAHAFLTGVVLYKLYEVQKQTEGLRVASLADVAMALSDPKQPIEKLYNAMLENQFGNPETQRAIASAGRDMLNRPAQERGSVLSSAMSHLSLYRDPVVAKNIQKSDFKITHLMNHDKPLSLYLVVRPADKDRLKPLMRLLLNQIIRVLAREEIRVENGMAKPVHKRRLLLMLDEFPSFGRLEVFQEALAFLAGYGIKAYLIMQDTAQLEQCYGKHESILSNCHVTIAYAPNKQETAEWLSKMLGTKTVVIEDTHTSGRRVGGYLERVNMSFRSVARPLLNPDECRGLKGPVKENDKIVEPGDMVILMAGHPPILGTQILYFQTEYFSEAAKKAPPQQSDRIPFERKKMFQTASLLSSVDEKAVVQPETDEDISNTILAEEQAEMELVCHREH